jgi:hypothetical protein
MNKISTEERTRVVACLVEGNSLRATARMTGVHRTTVMKLLADLGKACSEYQDKTFRNLTCKRIQCDEIWSFVGCKQKNVRPEDIGKPVYAHVSTSICERNNLNMRMNMRRMTRLTNAFSKKVENLEHSVALHFMHYNFCRIHGSLRVTPAMEAGVADHVWSLEEVIALLD